MDRLNTMWRDALSRFQIFWSGQSRTSQIGIAGGAAVVLLGAIFLGTLYFGHGPTYGVLFSNLSPEDANTVTQHLKDDKVPYQLSTDGKTISVPAQNVSDERVAIAGAGLLKGSGVGYELFDRTNFGMTDFQERIDKTRAIEGELERTIDGLTPVQAARVNIATPDQTLYTSTQQPTTASIAITTKPGETLSRPQVNGITLLVSRAVDGLKPENVTIVNQDGQILLPTGGKIDQNGGNGGPDALQLTQEQLLAKQRYETNLQQNIQSMLDDTLGKGHAVARVATQMDFDVNSSEGKVYAPQGTVLSSQNSRETYKGTPPANGAAVGVPGTTSNIGTYQAVATNTGTGQYNKSQATTNFDISVQNVKHVGAPGKVTQTSVAVIVNSAASTTTAPGATTATAYQLTPANVQQIRNSVVAAAGLDLARGDQVSVEAIPFNPALLPNPTSGVATTVLGIPVWVLAVIGGLGILGLLGFLAGRSRRSAGSGFQPSIDAPSFETGLMEELPPFEEHPMIGAGGINAPIRSAADLTREQMIEYVTTVAQENPESIAKLVKLWLAE